MNFLEIFMLNSIYILFPLITYLFYFAYTKALEKNTNNLVLDFCLLTSFYLTVRFGILSDIHLSILILNIPLLIAYLNKRNISIIVLSISIVCYYMNIYNLWFIALEYIIYFLLYLKIIKKDNNKNLFINMFIILKTLSTIICLIIIGRNNLYSVNILNLIFYLVLFWALNYLIIYLLRKGEEIIKLQMTLKELQKEKQIRTSLFKITHEIKNPIAVCKGYLDMFDVNNENHARKYIPIIRSEINRTLLLLQDFLDCNRLKINKDVLDINLLLEDVEDECKPLIKEKKINYISDIDDEELYIEGDYERLKQVFINIVKNSIEAIVPSSDSYIEVSTKIIKNNIHIFIEDNGQGISKEDLEKIKEPFYTTKKTGTGLGITLSIEIIKAHNGIIEYTSEQNKWTKVEIILPIKK